MAPIDWKRLPSLVDVDHAFESLFFCALIDWKLLTIPSKRLTTKIRHSLVTPIDWKLINPLVGIIYTVLRNNQKTRSPSAKPPLLWYRTDAGIIATHTQSGTENGGMVTS